VESWALALDVIQSPLAQTIITPEPAPILKPEPKIIIPPKPAPVISSNKIGKFIVQDGIATDTKTGLMWLRFAHGQRWENGTVEGIAEKVSWRDGIEIPKAFSYENHNDWRVPNIDELETLIDKVKGKNGNYIDVIDVDVFPKNDNDKGQGFFASWFIFTKFWSSSLSADGSSHDAQNVSFCHGSSYGNYKSSHNCVRLVRGRL